MERAFLRGTAESRDERRERMFWAELGSNSGSDPQALDALSPSDVTVLTVLRHGGGERSKGRSGLPGRH